MGLSWEHQRPGTASVPAAAAREQRESQFSVSDMAMLRESATKITGDKLEDVPTLKMTLMEVMYHGKEKIQKMKRTHALCIIKDSDDPMVADLPTTPASMPKYCVAIRPMVTHPSTASGSSSEYSSGIRKNFLEQCLWEACIQGCAYPTWRNRKQCLMKQSIIINNVRLVVLRVLFTQQ